MTEQATKETKSIDWVKNISTELRSDDSKALRVERSGYVAFVRYDEGYHYEVLDRHYDEDEWHRKEIAQTTLMGYAARLSQHAEVVEMPDLDDVEVSLDGGESA